MPVEKYKYNETVVKAIQFTGDNFKEIERWTLRRIKAHIVWSTLVHYVGPDRNSKKADSMELTTRTAAGVKRTPVAIGDYVVSYGFNNFVIVPKKDFTKEYEKIV